MKKSHRKSQPTLDKTKELILDVRGTKYKCASQEALLQYLVESKPAKRNLKKIATGRYSWFTSIKRGDGVLIHPSDIYWSAREIIARKKRLAKEYASYRPKASKNVKGYFFAAMENDPISRDEPRGKHLEQRGFYDEPETRRTERNWKSFRKTQYK